MNKQLCLALSVNLALMQATFLPVMAEPANSAIWQKLSGANTATVARPAAKSAAKPQAAHRQLAMASQATAKAPAAASGQAMLFLSGKGSNAGALAGAIAPAAALTIHPAMPEADAAQPTPETPLVASAEPVALSLPTAAETPSAPIVGKDLLASLGGGSTLIAQGEAGPSAVPIPPVVTGTVDLEEFKSTNVIDLKVSQSRTFKLKNKIVRTSISDPSIAEPVVVSENQLVLLGKTPGVATMVLWDDAGNSVAIDLHVDRDYSQLQAALREIDPRIIVKAVSIGGTDRVILMGDVDHPDSVVRAFSASNVFMDDRGMNVQVANSRITNTTLGEQGGVMQGGGRTGQLTQLSSVDRYAFFPNINNNIAKAQVITSDGGRVTSLIKVRKVPLIVLHVSFLEMNTTAARELGVQLGFNMTAKSFGFGVGGSAQQGTALSAPGSLFAYPGTTSLLPTSSSPAISKPGAATQPVAFLTGNQVVLPTGTFPISGIGSGLLNGPASLIAQEILLGAPGGATFVGQGLSNLFTAISQISPKSGTKFGINPTINGIIASRRARVLAEPTLVTISGERASFLAGGEIPIPQQLATAGTAQQSITFEPFGMRINMIPVLMENGSINLEIAPEERIISNQFPLNFPFSLSNIPSFTTRKEQTIVELKPGQELFISGLVATNNGREMTKTPLLGEVPVLGALYRSKAFSKNESELVVAVRPEIILPGTPGQLKLPEEIGRVEGPRDTNLFQVEPTVVDERHYTSGRVERTQKTSPTLPEGAPVPDNE